MDKKVSPTEERKLESFSKMIELIEEQVLEKGKDIPIFGSVLVSRAYVLYRNCGYSPAQILSVFAYAVEAMRGIELMVEKDERN